jgi:hypothetical protein
VPFQLNEGGLTHAYELDQLSLTYPFPFPQCGNALTNMLPWGQVASYDIQAEGVEHCPEGTQIALSTFQQPNGRHREHSLSSKILLAQFSIFPLSFQLTSQRRVMARKFEHIGVQ